MKYFRPQALHYRVRFGLRPSIFSHHLTLRQASGLSPARFMKCFQALVFAHENLHTNIPFYGVQPGWYASLHEKLAKAYLEVLASLTANSIQ